MFQAALKEKVIVKEESLQDYERRRKDEKVKNWKEKALHGVFVQQISDEAGEESWRWLRNGFLKKETEGLILAAQEQALRTNSIKYSIDKTSETPPFRLCGDATETSVDARSLPKESIGSATTRWPCGYTGRCAGSMG